LAGCDSTILRFNPEGTFLNTTMTNGLVSGILPISETENYIIDPGILDPHDNKLGALKVWNSSSSDIITVKDQLARPVYLNQVDSILFISEYGNEKGQLSELNLSNNKLNPASNLPGAYKSIVFDYDQDGNDEILVMFAQALEGVYVREVNRTDKSFVPLLSFIPEWGISDIDTADVNQDGWTDLIIANGDNADYSMLWSCVVQ